VGITAYGSAGWGHGRDIAESSAGRLLEPHRRSAVHDPLTEVGASRQEGDRGSRWIGHHIGGQLGEQHDAFGTDLLHRPDTNPARARWAFGCGETNDGNLDESRRDCDEGDER
jgi:hypothetical protein